MEYGSGFMGALVFIIVRFDSYSIFSLYYSPVRFNVQSITLANPARRLLKAFMVFRKRHEKNR